MGYAAARDAVSRPGATTDAGVMVARAARTVRGRVIDELSCPVGGAQVSFVSVLRSDRYPESEFDSDAAYSRADGSFQIQVPPVEVFLLVEKRGYGTIPTRLADARQVILPRPAFVLVDLAEGARRDGVD